MGCLFSGDSIPQEDKTLDQRLNKKLAAAKVDSKEVKKLLLLGAGGSGKSTFFKQLQRIHGNGFSERERLNYKTQINEQIITQMQLLVEKNQELVNKHHHDELRMSPDVAEQASQLQYLRNITELTEDVVQIVKLVWADEPIKRTYDMRAKLGLFDSSEYFFDKVEEIGDEAYLPEDDDLLRVRHRTTGINEKDFIIEDTIFRIVDVGGQRSERRKWIHCFDQVTSVIFVASLSCYDEVLYEDEEVNVMHETLEVFKSTCNSHWFQKIAFILFLNKEDLFDIKIASVPITECWSDYQGPGDKESCLGFIKEVFQEQNENQDSRRLYIHVTTATDEKNVERVFNDVQQIVINKSLTTSGLL